MTKPRVKQVTIHMVLAGTYGCVSRLGPILTAEAEGELSSCVTAFQVIVFTKLSGKPIVSPEAADTQQITSKFGVVDNIV